MPNLTVKEEARQLVEQLPEDASWEDVFYRPRPARSTRTRATSATQDFEALKHWLRKAHRVAAGL